MIKTFSILEIKILYDFTIVLYFIFFPHSLEKILFTPLPWIRLSSISKKYVTSLVFLLILTYRQSSSGWSHEVPFPWQSKIVENFAKQPSANLGRHLFKDSSSVTAALHGKKNNKNKFYDQNRKQKYTYKYFLILVVRSVII